MITPDHDTPDAAAAAPARGGHKPRKGVGPDAQAWLTDAGGYTREHRNTHDISPAAVAAESGDDVSQVLKWERGLLNMTIGRLHPILAAMGLRLVIVPVTDQADITRARL